MIETEWSQPDVKMLVELVKRETTKEERVRFSTRLLKFDWDKIKFKNYTAENCRDKFTELQKPLRRYRNLNDICLELEEEVGKFAMKKPQTPLQLYIADELKRNDRPFVSRKS